MTNTAALDVFLHDRRIGSLVHLDGDGSIFSFDSDYVADATRPTLSLSYKDSLGGLIDTPRAYRTRIEPFFSNLLPEGTLRDFLARRAGVKALREFPLLTQLGEDLPGAVKVLPVDNVKPAFDPVSDERVDEAITRTMRFSLAGVQLKFSGIRGGAKNAGLTIPASGTGGDWIVKLPSVRHPDVPEAEFAAMMLGRQLGIDVPEIDLIPIEAIEGLPEGIQRYGQSAYAIRRFDRSPDGTVHIEDFAQVFGVYPDEKYKNASYRQLLAVLAIETDETSVVEFVRRLTYCVLIGNGDMHLKNWSLAYPDRHRPILAPAYDLLSTVAYLPEDDAALKFHRSRQWDSFSYAELAAIADKARLPSHLVVSTARETVALFDQLWDQQHSHLPFPREVVEAIDRHRKKLVV